MKIYTPNVDHSKGNQGNSGIIIAGRKLSNPRIARADDTHESRMKRELATFLKRVESFGKTDLTIS